MRKQTVDAKSKKDAQKQCPWAEVIVRVDSGGKQKAWMCFESRRDYEIWKNQK